MRLPDLNDLIQDLQLAKEIAIKNENVNGLVNSVMSQAKLLGLDKAINHTEPLPNLHVSYEDAITVDTVIERMKELDDDY